jgi:flagellar biosynthesis GTPase FlhF
MQVKKFQAENMPEALKMVKAEFGLDAMILNSREERRKGILGFFRKPYVEVTAAIGNPSTGRAQRDTQPDTAPANTREEFRNAMLEPLVREIKQLRDKVEILFEKEADREKSPRLLLEDNSEEPARSHYPEAAEGESGRDSQKSSGGPTASRRISRRRPPMRPRCRAKERAQRSNRPRLALLLRHCGKTVLTRKLSGHLSKKSPLSSAGNGKLRKSARDWGRRWHLW